MTIMKAPRNSLAEINAFVYSYMPHDNAIFLSNSYIDRSPPPEQLQYFISDFKTIFSCLIEGTSSAMWLFDRWLEQSSMQVTNGT